MVDTSTSSWKLLYESGRQALQDRKLQEAEQSFSAALQLAEDFPPGDPRLSATLNALARIYSLQRRYLAAAALLNRLLEVTERTLGPTHVQVAGVLTNLAEMYTHLGAAREELELRERVLGIRGDDPNADATSLRRLRERVGELHAQLAQESTPDTDEFEQEPLPTVRTSEYSAPIPTIREPEPAPMVAQSFVTRESIATATVEPEEETFSYDGDPRASTMPSPSVEIISIDEEPALATVATVDHGFSDMGRDELQSGVVRKIGSRSSLYSIAAGVVLVAALLAARDRVKGSDDSSVSAGSVSLAAASTPARPVVSAPAPEPAETPAPAPEQRTVERILADRKAEEDARRAAHERESATRSGATSETTLDRPPRAPSTVDLEKTLRNVDVAVKAIDQRTKAATDSALTIKMQTPTFKKVKMSDPNAGPMVVVP
jgi:tetratricopeptide (TPR) repeat protein